MLFLAMSCFQARPQNWAFEHLMQLNPDGIQLTPGNYPTNDFKKLVDNIPHTFHHGFCWDKYRREVYDDNLSPTDIEYTRSIHPPRVKNGVSFTRWIENSEDHIYETMYPGYYLGSGAEIEIAMSLRKRLAIDISHVHIMKCANLISDLTIKKLFAYDQICEIHVSHNEGRVDNHLSINSYTPFLSEIKNRKCPIIYESYLHKLSFEDRKKQIDMVRNLI